MPEHDIARHETASLISSDKVEEEHAADMRDLLVAHEGEFGLKDD